MLTWVQDCGIFPFQDRPDKQSCHVPNASEPLVQTFGMDMEERCKRTTSSQNRSLSFDVNSLSSFEVVEAFAATSSHIIGAVQFVHGTPDQEADIGVHTHIRSTSDEDVDRFFVSQRKRVVEARISVVKSNARPLHGCVLVSLVIHPGHQIGTVYIKTSQLHVGFEDDLGWSVDNLTSHTDYGMIRLNDNNPSNFLANTLSLSAVDGYVTGRFGPASNLHLKSESGAIGGFACRTQESKTSSFKRYRCTQKVER